MRDLLIREAGPQDAAVVREVMRAAFVDTRVFPHPSSALVEALDEVAGRLGSGGALGLVGADVVASVRFVVEEGVLTYERLAVRPSFWGRGIGGLLVDWVEAWGWAAGAREVRVTARSRWPDNRPFYLRRGYEVTGSSGRYGVPDLRVHLRKRR